VTLISRLEIILFVLGITDHVTVGNTSYYIVLAVFSYEYACFVQATDNYITKSQAFTFNLKWTDCSMDEHNFTVTLQEKKAYQIMLLGQYSNSAEQTILVISAHF